MEFLPGESAIAVRVVLSLLVAIPATMLAALFSSLPERSIGRAIKAGFLIFLSWLFFTVVSFNITNSVVSLLFDIADFLLKVSIFELTYKTTFKRGIVAGLLFLLCSTLLTLVMVAILGVCFAYFALALFSAEQQKQLAPVRSKARLHSVETEVVKYHAAHGGFPESLAEISGSVVTDDLFGRPILYKITGANTAELSSLGQDGIPGGIRENSDTTVIITLPKSSPD